MTLSTSSTQQEKNAHYRQMISDYTRAITAHDPEAVLALYAEDAVLEDPIGSGSVVAGRDALREFYTRVCNRDIKLSVDGHISCSKGNVACAPVRVDVESSSIHAISVVHFNDQGLIVRYDAHWGPGDIEGADPSTGADYGTFTPYDDHWNPADRSEAAPRPAQRG